MAEFVERSVNEGERFGHTVMPPFSVDLSDQPRLRGWIHAIAAGVAAVSYPGLVLFAPQERRIALIIYGVSLIELYAVSAAFHLGRWRGLARRWIRLLDHASIFVAIAAADTAFVSLAAHSTASAIPLTVVWVSALAGIAAKICHGQMSRTLSTGLYLMTGWASGWIWLSLLRATNGSDSLASLFGLIALAGILHTFGALVYARRWPDPWPSTFGYHELFHSLVVLGNLLVSISIIRLAFA